MFSNIYNTYIGTDNIQDTYILNVVIYETDNLNAFQ